MALDKDKLIANEALKDLDDTQIATIVTLSSNDEEAVIGQKIGELHGQYDKDIEAVTGMKKPDGVKTYEYLKTNVLPLVKQGQTLVTEKAALATEIVGLKKQIEDNSGDEVLTQSLKDMTQKFNDLDQKYTTDIATHTKTIEELTLSNSETKIDQEFNLAVGTLKFKEDMDDGVRDTFIKSKIAKIKSTYKTDFIDNGKGNKVLAFRDDQGVLQNNPENGLNPFTAKELLSKELTPILQTGSKGGAGTKPDHSKKDDVVVLDFTGIKTQVAADDLIDKYLLSQGKTREDQTFSDEAKKLRDDNKVSSLPLR